MGNSDHKSKHNPTGSVHPRVCGELWLARSRSKAKGGSSPRVWGTPQRCQFVRFCLRFIPACVGNSNSGYRADRASSVHPRVCGELCSQLRTPRPHHGSSPRVWGTRIIRSFDTGNARFIPACVGNSWNFNTIWGPMSVHPRVCGELPFRHVRLSLALGSSPRVWGTHQYLDIISRVVWFIPACVGNSSQSS